MGAERMGANTCYACLCLVAIALSLPVEFHIGNEAGVHTVVPEVSFAAEPMPPPVSNIELGAISPALQKAEAETESSKGALKSAGNLAKKIAYSAKAEAGHKKEELNSAQNLADKIKANAEKVEAKAENSAEKMANADAVKAENAAHWAAHQLETTAENTKGDTYKCADEHEHCKCNGIVWYGAPGNLATLKESGHEHAKVDGVIKCNNDYFSDPLYGTFKQCICETGAQGKLQGAQDLADEIEAKAKKVTAKAEKVAAKAETAAEKLATDEADKDETAAEKQFNKLKAEAASTNVTIAPGSSKAVLRGADKLAAKIEIKAQKVEAKAYKAEAQAAQKAEADSKAKA